MISSRGFTFGYQACPVEGTVYRDTRASSLLKKKKKKATRMVVPAAAPKPRPNTGVEAATKTVVAKRAASSSTKTDLPTTKAAASTAVGKVYELVKVVRTDTGGKMIQLQRVVVVQRLTVSANRGPIYDRHTLMAHAKYVLGDDPTAAHGIVETAAAAAAEADADDDETYKECLALLLNFTK